MTEQIIVDGVDVTKCPSYMDFKKCTMLSYVSACEGSCAYTGFHNLLKENEKIKNQLQAKEKECERLKKYLAEIKEIAEHWHNEWINDPDERLGFEKILQKLSEVE